MTFNQVPAYSFPLLTTDYAPGDRDPRTLPPVSIRETKRYAYLEDDFDTYLGNAMATTTFFSTAPSEN